MKQGSCCVVCKLMSFLVVIGALNWGAVGIFQTNFVASLLGDMTTPARLVYGLIGVAGLLKAISCVKPCPCCKTDAGECKK